MLRFITDLLSKKLKHSLVASLTILTLLLTAGCSLLDEQTSNGHTVTSPSHIENSQVTQNDESEQQEANQSEEEQPLTSFNEVASFIREHGSLPPNFITKNEARELGWVPAEGNLAQVAPGKSIGGDRFRNREGLLPNSEGRIWYEADINYVSGTRGSERIVYSNDGFIYMTVDHYKSFTNITDEGSLSQ